ncbi:albusnodin/ikarugamycin family macrolactam cyclase [Nocardiopsis kunsanensis]|uniref:albusnodin/ikarugamycin family macrolactam cyclase n=1 Tax=Nocardiopsis kunsanensis TaxID=141693 RepID=UPI000A06598E|nr:albusnodin/ikarugamycin family macrolactam cyclase [Nocardiopsis kunsanensis]
MTDYSGPTGRGRNQKRWFGGCALSGGKTPVPTGAAPVWPSPALWTVGPWAERRVRTYHGDGVRIAVIGTCSADRTQLAEAARISDPTAVTESWSGSFTVVRSTRDGVEVITDASGACPVYTTRTRDGLIVWGSSSYALSALHGGRIDREWFSAYLGDKHSAPRDRSAWAGVRPVPPGHRLFLTPDSMTMSRWWTPVSRPREDALDRIRSALVDGVHARVRGGGVSTDLSGVDSTTLAVIAAQHVPVTGVTAHPTGLTEGGDLLHTRDLNVPGLTRERFEVTERHLPFSPFTDTLPPTDEPPPSAASWSAFAGQLRAARQTEAQGCHLTGDGGDNLFLPPPTHLVALAQKRQWAKLWNDASAWARLRRRAPWPYVRSALTHDVASLARSAPSAPPWLLCSAPERTRPENPDEALVSLVHGVARAAASDTQLADHVGVEQHNPYFDGAVLDAVVSLRAADRFSAHRYKPALMDAIGDLLPAVVRERTTKGSFVSDYHRAVRLHLDRVLSMCEGPLTEAELVDPGKLRSTVHAAALGARVPWAHLLTTLGTHLWWQSVEKTPAPCWYLSKVACV